MKTFSKRLLTMILAVAMVFSLSGMTAFAKEAEDSAAAGTEETAAAVESEQDEMSESAQDVQEESPDADADAYDIALLNNEEVQTFADSPVCEIDGTQYDSIQDAVAAIKDDTGLNSSTITLITDAAGPLHVTTDLAITLDLNGYTLTDDDNEETNESAHGEDRSVTLHNLYGVIINEGTLTIMDSSVDKNGTVDGKDMNYAAIVNEPGAACTIDDVTVTRSNDTTQSQYTVINHGAMEITGATITSPGTGSTVIANGYQDGSNYRNDWSGGDVATYMSAHHATLTINDGTTVTGGKHNVKSDMYGSLTINGGTFYNETNDCIYTYDDTTINDGTFISTATQVIYDATKTYEENREDGSLKVNGGTFIAAGDSTNILQANSAADVTITDGTFTIEGSGAVISTEEGADVSVKGGTFDTPFQSDVLAEGCVEVGYNGTVYVGTAEEVSSAILTAAETAGETDSISITIYGGEGDLNFGTEYSVIVTAAEGYGYESGAISVDGTKIADNADGQNIGPVCEIGDTKYLTLQEAVAAAQDGDTITLIADATGPLHVPVGLSITLALNGYTLTDDNITESGESAFGEANSVTVHNLHGVIINEGTLAICDYSTEKARTLDTNTGTIDAKDGSYAAIVNEPGATCTIDDVTVTRSNDASGQSQYTVINHGAMEITGATITNPGTGSTVIANGYQSGTNYRTDWTVDGTITDVKTYMSSNHATLIINEGTTVTGGKHNVKSDVYGSLTINGGTFYNETNDCIYSYDDTTIIGGTFTSTAAQVIYDATTTEEYDEQNENGSLTVNGGTFIAAGDSTNILQANSAADVTITDGTFIINGSGDMISADDDAKIAISGGKYSEPFDPEYVPEGYVESSYVDENGNTWYELVEAVSIAGTVKWDDNNNAEGERPNNVYVILLADDQMVDAITVPADGTSNEWTFAFADQPKYDTDTDNPINYSVVESAVTNYTTTYDANTYDGNYTFTITNTHTLAYTDVTVTKVWSGDDEEVNARPETVTVNVMQTADGGTTSDVAASMTLSSANDWTNTVDKLPKYDENGKAYEYSVEEVAVENYSSSISHVSGTTTFVCLNTYESTEVTVFKEWEDNDNTFNLRPDSIEVSLLADDVEVATGTLEASTGWTYTFTGLPITSDGDEITYTVAEDVEDYTSAVSEPTIDRYGNTEYTITNTAMDPVCQIDGVYFTSLTKAIEAVEENLETSTTIKMLADVEESVVIPSGKTITLDLAGCTISTDGQEHAEEQTDSYKAVISNEGNLTITDSVGGGTVDAGETASVAALSNDIGATCVLNGGTFRTDIYYCICNEGTMTINKDVTVISTYGSSALVENGFYSGSSQDPDATSATLTINGGTFTGGNYNVKNDDYGVLVINGGSFTNTTEEYGCVQNWNVATINGGDFTAANVVIYDAGNSGNNMDKGSLTITDGTFTSTGKSVILAAAGSGIAIEGGTFVCAEEGEIIIEKEPEGENPRAEITITDGMFNKEIDTNDGYIPVEKAEITVEEDGNTWYTITDSVCSINDTVGYATIADAIAAAAEGDTIALRTDISENIVIPAELTVTLDLAGFTLSAAEDTDPDENPAVIVNNGTLTITDSSTTETEAGTGKVVTGETADVAAISNNSGAACTIEDGTFASDSDTICNEGSMTITGGTFTSESGSVIQVNEGSETEIQGGKFVCAESAESVFEDTTSDGANVSITGGLFNKAFDTDYVPEGYAEITVEEDDTTWYTVTNAVCEIDGFGYATIADALAAANSGDTITMVADAAESIVIPADLTVTLDLNGHTISTDGNESAEATTGGYKAVIVNEGTLTITDSSEEKTGMVDAGTTKSVAALSNDIGATCILSGGTFTTDSYYCICNEGTMTINEGVTVTSTDDGSSMIENGFTNGSKQDDSGTPATLTINGGTFTGGLYNVKNDDYGELTINGGTFTNTRSDGGCILNWNKATINGGDFTAAHVVLFVATGNEDGTNKSDMDQGLLTIKGGTFTVSGEEYGSIVQVNTDANVSIEGGTFTWPATDGLIYESTEGGGAEVSVTDGYFSNKVDTQYIPKEKAETTVEEGGKTWYILVDSICAIGDIGYASIADAIAAAVIDVDVNNQTITMLADTEESIVIPSTLTVTLDLNGHTISTDGNESAEATTGSYKAVIVNEGTLTITDSSATETEPGTGKVDAGETANVAALSNDIGATCVLNGGTFTTAKYYCICNEGTMTIYDGVTVTSTDEGASMIENGFTNGSTQDTSKTLATLTIEGGTFTGGLYNVKNDDYGELTINGGTFTNTRSDGGCILNWNKATINGGDFTAAHYVLFVATGTEDGTTKSEMDQGLLTITGGTFTVSGEEYGSIVQVNTDANVRIEGGYFTWPETDDLILQTTTGGGAEVSVTDGYFSNKFDTQYIPEGKAETTYIDANGVTWIVLADAVCEIGDTAYASIAEAIAAAEDDDTIKMVADTAESIVIPSTLTVTLDLAGCTITGDGNESKEEKTDNYPAVIVNEGTLTIKDSVGGGAVATSGNKVAMISNDIGATCTIDGGTYETEAYYAISNQGTMTINEGVTVTSTDYDSSLIENGFYKGIDENQEENLATLTINGGTFTGGMWNVKCDEYGVVEINDGTFSTTSDGNGCILNWNETTINGGTFSSEYVTIFDAVGDDDDFPATDAAQGIVTINGGTFSSVQDSIVYACDDSKITITDGTFSGSGTWPIIDEVTPGGGAEISATGGVYTEKLDTDYIPKGYMMYEFEDSKGTTWYFIDEAIVIYGEKVWDDGTDRDGERPVSVDVMLLANGDVVETETVTKGDDDDPDVWAWSFAQQPKYEVDTTGTRTEIQYTVLESEIEDYSATYDYEIDEDGFYDVTITNTHTPDTTSLTVAKIWSDNDNAAGQRPESVTMQLLADGDPALDEQGNEITVELSVADNWTHTFTDLPKNHDSGKEYTYSVQEAPVANYKGEITLIENTSAYVCVNTYQSTKVTVYKEWDDDDNQDGARPESVAVSLLADGDEVDTATLTSDEHWTYTFDDLPLYNSDSEEIVYTVAEEDVEGYAADVTGSVEDGFTITNTHEDKTVDISVEKEWVDNENADETRPDSVTVHLWNADTETHLGSATLEEATGWTYTWEEQPMYANGSAINYEVTEEAVAGYESEVSGDVENGFTVTNTYDYDDTVDITGTKVWEDNDNQDGVRPDHVTIELYADGDPALDGNGDPITIDVTPYTTLAFAAPSPIAGFLAAEDVNEWNFSFKDLPKYDESGSKIEYTLAELAVENYDSEIIGDMTDGFTITNTHTPATITVSGTKTWDDEDNQDSLRPSSITLQLMANGQPATDASGQEIYTDATADDWTWAFDKVDQCADGAAIAYSVEEVAVDGYEASYESATDEDGNYTIAITNTHTVQTIDVSFDKIWDDNGNQDNEEPDSITVRLLADGQVIDHMTAIEEDGWSGTFTDLPVYQDGNPITYTITEDAISGYTPAINDAIADADGNLTFTITNTHTPDQTSVTVTKAWDDNNDQDGNRPQTVTVNLLADGVQAHDADGNTCTAELSEGNWTYTFTGLDEYEFDSEGHGGQKVDYTVEEVSVDGYVSTTTGDATTGYVITNSYTPETTSVTVNKVWEDDNNRDRVQHEYVTVRLRADGKEVDSARIAAEDDWTHTFTELPKYENGQEISYTVTEDAMEDYTSEITGDAESGYTITNTHTPEKMTISVSKVWEDGNDQDGYRAEGQLYVQLFADGVLVQETSVYENKGWTGEFTDVPVYDNGQKINYTVKEVTFGQGAYESVVTGDATTGFTITNYHTPETLDVTVTKVWEDGDNVDGFRPESVTVTLVAENTFTREITEQSVEVSAATDWSFAFTDLPKYGFDTIGQGEADIAYSIKEVEVPEGYKSTISDPVKDGDNISYTITNTHTPETITVSGTKVWEDENDQDGVRPNSVTVSLYANGALVDTDEVSGDDWTFEFEELPKYADGKKITYTVVEDAEEDYSTTYEYDVDDTTGDYNVTVTNTHTPDETSLTVMKVWSDKNNQDGKRPATVTMQLLRDGDIVDGATLNLSEADNWTGTFDELPKYHSGTVYEYSVQEVEVSGYESEITPIDGTTAYVCVNTYEPEQTQVTVQKKWDDDNNRDGKRPNEVTVSLLANDNPVLDESEEPITATLSETNNWSYTFGQLPVYSDSEKIEYSVSEAAVDGYVTTYAPENGAVGEDGIVTITNSYEPETITVSGTKVWEDENDQDGVRPKSVSVSLYANGALVDTAEVSGEDWTFDFGTQPKNASGTAIQYTVVEDTVEDYTPEYASEVDQTTGDYEFTITNTHTPDETSLTVMKIWSDKNNQDGVRPNDVTMQLLRDGDVVEDATLTLDDSNNWTDTFTGLPKYHDSGKEYTYSVQEVAVDNYTSELTKITDTAYVCVNTYQSEETEVTVYKKWDDGNNQDGNRPESIEVSLLADGDVSATATLCEDNNWSHTFGELPVYSDSEKITYTVSEDAVVGYQTTYEPENGAVGEDGIVTITNTYTPETINVSGSKTWVDSDEQLKERPETIKLTLYANGNVAGTVDITAASGWAFDFGEQAKNAEGSAITYTVAEDAVDAYTPTYSYDVDGSGNYTITVTNTHDTVDKSLLKEAIDDAEALEEHKDDYTADSWDALVQALEKAQEVYEAEGATAEEVNQATIALVDAIASLQAVGETVDKTDLLADYVEGMKLNEEDYTVYSWDVLESALEQAQKVLTNPNATESDVTEAKTALESAMGDLVNLSELKKAIAEAESLDSTEYTESSWLDVEYYLEKAEEAVATEDIDQAQVNTALEELQGALDALVKAGDKTDLDSAIAEAEDLVENNADDYTADSLKALEDAITAAKTVATDSNATQDQVDTALQALDDAIDGLVNIAGLNDLIKEAEELASDTDAYTDASLEALNNAITAAQEVVNATDPTASAADVQAAEEALQNAIDGLVAAADKSVLETTLETVGTLDKNSYTDESWAALQAAITAAEGVVADGNASQSAVDEALNYLVSAIAGLQAVGETVDKSDLLEDYVEASKLDESDYTPETWQALEEALEQAQKVLTDPKATEEEVTKAEEALQSAMNGLEPIPAVDKEVLKAAIEAAEGLTESDYTEETWEALKEALEEAREAYYNPNARQEDVNSATVDLVTAIAGLQFEQPPKTEADKSDLLDEYAADMNLNEDDYTPETWEALQGALEDAESVLLDPDATQKDVDAALAALQRAKKNLQSTTPEPSTTEYNGVVKGPDGVWGYYVDNALQTSYTGVAPVKNENGWWYIKEGLVDFSANTVAKNQNGWWYVKDGKVDFNHNGVDKNENGWWYVVGGKVQFDFTGLGNYGNSNGWWYINNGKVTFDHNGVDKNVNGWWYVVDSKVQFNFTGLADYKNVNGWWYINAGKVTFDYTGVATNKNGTWYVKDSKVDFSYNGSVSSGGRTYNVVNGKVS